MDQTKLIYLKTRTIYVTFRYFISLIISNYLFIFLISVLMMCRHNTEILPLAEIDVYFPFLLYCFNRPKGVSKQVDLLPGCFCVGTNQ